MVPHLATGASASGDTQKAMVEDVMLSLQPEGDPMSATEHQAPSPQDVAADFDPRLKVYLVLYVSGILISTIVGILALPLWIPLGSWWANLYFPSIQARLGARSLVYSHGVWFRQEMNIPLDKIQDVSLHHGPILDYFGLAMLRVETAGGGQAGSHASLIGVRDAVGFRTAIIARRDAITANKQAPASDGELLMEIRDSLLRIEAALGQRRDG